MVSGVFAVKSNNNFSSEDLTGPIYFNTIVNSSKMVFDNFHSYNNKPSNMGSFSNLNGYLNNKSLMAKYVQKTKNKLKQGDIVQLKNTDHVFLVFMGMDSQGQIHLEDQYHEFTWTNQHFDKLFTGYTVQIGYNLSNNATTENLSDGFHRELNSLIEDVELLSVPMEKKQPPQSDYDWENAANDPRIIAMAESVTANEETPRDKCIAIFKYVQENYRWHDHEDTTCSISQVLGNKTGNCCELSRLVIAMIKSADIPVETRYKHSQNYYYYSHKTGGHIDVQVKIDEEWEDADVTSIKNTFGEPSPIYKENYILAYYDDLPF